MIKSKRKAKGFTLIELMLVITIMSILLSYSFINLGGLSKLQNDMEIDTFGNTLVNFINNSKDYCRENKMGGYIYLDAETKDIDFRCAGEEIGKLSCPGKVTLSTSYKIKISNRGMAESCTIRFKDKEGKIYHTTICVGTSYVDFKD